MTLYKMVNGEHIKLTPEEEATKLAEWAASDQKKLDDAWLHSRINEYPDIIDQLDTIYHSGIEGWKAAIKEIKDKYPKPEVE